MNTHVIVLAVVPADQFPDFEAAMPGETLLVTMEGTEGATLARLAGGQQICLLAKNLGRSLEHDNYKKVLQ